MALALLVVAASLVACNIGSYDDAVKSFNSNNQPPPPPPGPPPPPPPPGASFGPTFSEIQAGLFTPSCATVGCHSGANPDGDLNLEAANSYAMLIGIASSQQPGVQLVNPGNPDMSYLVQKLENAAGITGGQMPPSGTIPQPDIDVVRQWISDGAMDDTVQPATPIRVTTLAPAPGAALTAAPTQITAGFDREVDASTVNANTFLLFASGGDAIFGNGNDVNIAATAISVPGANPQSAVFDLAGVTLADDSYQVRLLGDGASVIMDLDANALDGENFGGLPSGDGAAGGDFIAQFSIATPVVIGPTLDQIQAVIFTPMCAGCHGGPVPSGDLSLVDADTSHAELVGVASSQQAGATLVIIMDPDNSYLIQKLEDAPGIAGLVMPPGAALQQSDIDEVRQWIADGAVR